MRFKELIIFSFFAISFLLAPSAFAYSEFGYEQVNCQKCNLACPDRFVPKAGVSLQDKGETKEILVFDDISQCGQNCDIVAYVYDGESCKQVLFGAGGSGFDFTENENSPYPNIVTRWHMSASDAEYDTYIWYDRTYVHEEELRKRLNKNAFGKFKKGRFTEAISLWQKIDSLGLANSEVLNNIGFAYYKLWKKDRNDEHYTKAKKYLERSISVEPGRWSALLNLGDLFYESNEWQGALENYELLLGTKPNYKYSKKIKSRILELRSALNNKNS